mmetsp:Transcript_7721/g.28266  ORF Transcript_7721/g.28266 Transcript_7721/m.28266 type:complete len:219 (+) Transcript_7721:3228-3884(+)
MTKMRLMLKMPPNAATPTVQRSIATPPLIAEIPKGRKPKALEVSYARTTSFPKRLETLRDCSLGAARRLFKHINRLVKTTNPVNVSSQHTGITAQDVHASITETTNRAAQRSPMRVMLPSKGCDNSKMHSRKMSGRTKEFSIPFAMAMVQPRTNVSCCVAKKHRAKEGGRLRVPFCFSSSHRASASRAPSSMSRCLGNSRAVSSSKSFLHPRRRRGTQ